MKYAALLFTFLNLLHLIFCDFDLVILHNNDIHGRFEQTERNSGTCQPKNRNTTCIGGFARTAHVIRKHREAAQNGTGPEVLYLYAGDTFIGTVWYTVHTWNISSTFMNLLRPDAQCLGNHEFDKGTKELGQYLSKLTFPTVTCNLDLSLEPNITPYVQKYIIIEKAGRKIGIIGYLTPETKKISSPEQTIFLDEIEEINKQAELLDQQGIKIIIAVGHSGYLKDKEIAEKVPLVDVVVGGHTNTFLWNGPQPDTDTIDGPYPTVITQPSGKKVPVVQAYAYTKYLGKLNLKFDDNGDLVHSYGQPILLKNLITQDKDVLELLEKYKPEVEKLSTEVGRSLVTLDGEDSSCRLRECNFGNLIADAFVLYKASSSQTVWTDTPIGITNAGGIRAAINPTHKGAITKGEIISALPYAKKLVSFKLSGADLVQTLECGIRGNGETSRGEFLQVSGIKVVYDASKPSYSRVVSVKVRCGNCSIPLYSDLNLSKNYTIVTSKYLTDGKDGFHVLKEKAMDLAYEKVTDVDTVVSYFNKYSPVFAEVEGRITFIKHDAVSRGSVFLSFNIVYLILAMINTYCFC
ncbi:protein 5NUC-like isoform X2 [Diabrotica virgifera virgifera]|uniref:5'-nucleotidase n=1 Tax=Diabrotica virgifera virgifera TaxID=50390 RepID=A0ABM5KZ98_DIAVI|nr:protein 5NUC-like isoform X2 [Diabrotica virgifera virgifera]